MPGARRPPIGVSVGDHGLLFWSAFGHDDRHRQRLSVPSGVKTCTGSDVAVPTEIGGANWPYHWRNESCPGELRAGRGHDLGGLGRIRDELNSVSPITTRTSTSMARSWSSTQPPNPWTVAHYYPKNVWTQMSHCRY